MDAETMDAEVETEETQPVEAPAEETQPADTEETGVDDTSARDATDLLARSAQAREKVEETEGEPETGALDARQLHALERAGMDPKEIMAELGDERSASLATRIADSLDDVSSRYAEIGMAAAGAVTPPDAEAPAAPVPAAQPAPAAGPLDLSQPFALNLDPEEWDADTVERVVRPLEGVVNALREQVLSMQQHITGTQQAEESRLVEAFFGGIPDMYRDAYGKGGTTEVTDAQRQARVALHQQAIAIYRGQALLHQQGQLKAEPNAEQCLQAALSLAQKDKTIQHARAEGRKEAQKRKAQTSPSGQSRATAGLPLGREKAVAAARDWYEQRGIPVPED